MEDITYTKKEVDEMMISNSLMFAKLAKQPLMDLATNKQSSLSFQKYSKSNIIKFLEAPDKNVKNIRDASIYMYNVSSHYRRLINYFAKMPTFAYNIIPYKFDISKAKSKNYIKQYTKVCNVIENMQIKHEFQKILTVVFREDVFYGICWETTDSFFIQKLNPDNCILSSIEDGVYNFAYDMSKIKVEELILYPPEFTTLYNEYKNDGIKYKEIPSKIGIVIKANEDISFPLPIFSGILTSLHDIEDFKSLMKQRSEVGNYKALSMRIPLNSDGTPQLGWDLALKYYNQLLKVLPDNIGAILSPMEMNAWNFEKSGNMADADEVHKSEEQFWTGAGTSSLLFGGGDNATSSSLKMSVKSDEEIVFALLAQIERWINRRMKGIGGTVKFKINMLPITIFNQAEMTDLYTKAATYGVPVKSSLCATLGLSPMDISGMSYLENEILQIPETFIPLSSSHTQTSSDDVGGSKTNEENGEGLTEEGEKTEKSDANANR